MLPSFALAFVPSPVGPQVYTYYILRLFNIMYIIIYTNILYTCSLGIRGEVTGLPHHLPHGDHRLLHLAPHPEAPALREFQPASGGEHLWFPHVRPLRVR